MITILIFEASAPLLSRVLGADIDVPRAQLELHFGRRCSRLAPAMCSRTGYRGRLRIAITLRGSLCCCCA